MLAVSWRDVVQAVLPSAQFTAGAPADDLAGAAGRLGALPEDLHGLLSETDGVRRPDGVDLIWPLDRIVHDNHELRSHPDNKARYGPMDDLLVFGDDADGGGDRVAFGPPGPVQILLWTPGTDARLPLATNLADYFTRILLPDGDEYGPGS
jgi:hypothetical protein